MKALGFVFGYARRYIGLLGVAVAAMLVLVGVQLYAPQIIRQLVTLVQTTTWDAVSQAAITRLALTILGIYIVRAVMQFISNYMAHAAGWDVVADVRRHIYEHLQRLSLGFYSEKQTGELMSRTINDSDLFERLISHVIPDTLVNAFMLVGVMYVMLRMNALLMALTLAPVPFVLLAMKAFGIYVRPAFRARQRELAELNASLAENLSGIREIKAFTREEIELGRITHHILRFRDSMLHALKLMAVFGPAVEFASSLGTIVVIYFGGKLAFQRTLPLSDLVAFFLYLEMFYQPIRALARVWEGLQESLAGADRVAELLDQTPDVADAPDATELGRVHGDVRLDHVTFRYNEGEVVLDDVSLELPANHVVALVGPTGVGKTTLAALLPRFYDVCAGSVTVDGHDVRSVTTRSLRQQMAIVLQDVFLFHGSVRENILFGRPEATEEEMVAAARVANAHEFIERLPEGYDTLIGERGVKLSGGQKQRISIARAVLKDAPILILDEATSSVDTETESLIQQALERLMVGRTTLVIAHRLSTVRHADCIVVLEGHRILEQGRHDELMARDGLYRRLWQVQSSVVSIDEAFGECDALGERMPL